MNTNKAITISNVLMVLSVIALVAGFVLGSLNADKREKEHQAKEHDVNNIIVSLDQISIEYNPNVKPYTNGCYYIYLDFTIQNQTGAELESLTMSVDILDDSGKTLATMNTKLGDEWNKLQIASKTTKTITSTWSDNQPEANNNVAFINVWELVSSGSDYSIKYTITDANWIDYYYYTY